MSNPVDIRSKITNWLLEEGISHTLSPSDPNFDFIIRVDKIYDTLFANISKEKGRERIYISITLNYQDEQSRKAYKKLNEKMKPDFYYELKTGLLGFTVEYNIDSNASELNSVLIQKPVYVEDMTKSSFMNTYNMFRDALVFLVLCTTKYFSIDTSPTQTQPRPPGMG